MFSKKATKIDKIFTIDLTVKISSIFVAYLENMNFKLCTLYSSSFSLVGGHFYIT